MNIENLVYNSKKALDLGQDKLLSADYDTAIALFASAYTDVRQLLERSWTMKREASSAGAPAGKDSG